MTQLRMKRGRLQSLFRYLPEQTYNWEKGRGSFKGAGFVDSRPLEIPKGWLRRPLRRLLVGYERAARAAGGNFRGLEVVEQGQFELLEPRTLRGEFFPRTFVCRQCDRFMRSDERPEAVVCRNCRVRMQQVTFVEYHRCGYISGLQPPACDNHCAGPMRLTGRTSRSVSEWRWHCSSCGLPAARNLYRGCPVCRSGTVRVFRADAGAVFYPQHVTVVNPPSEADYSVVATPDVHPAAVAQALGQLPASLDGLRDAVNEGGGAQATERLRRQLIEEFELPEDEAELLLARRRKRRESISGWETAVDDLGLDEETLDELGNECVELLLLKEARPLSVDNLAEDLRQHAPRSPLLAVYETDYRDVLRRFGLAEALLIREFPMAHVVAGFTREYATPRDNAGVRFNFFPREDGSDYPMYGQRITTEGLLFSLDPGRVVSWLARSGAIGDPGDRDPRAWLFGRLRPVVSIFEAPPDRLTRSVLGLLHTVSHRVIRALAIRSGLKATSLSEHLLPFNLAFLVYPNARTDFVLGGLEHVFRNYLHDCLGGMAEEHRCVFDPPCADRDGACAVCTFLAETSCERFNTVLSRHYLFGGRHDGVDWRGYWAGPW
jgi:Zn finger protein HypA/HybF involved in hydrogenase expression